MKNLYIEIGLRLNNRRKALKISQEYLAELTGLHRNYIYRIATALNITLEELFHGF